MVIVIWKTFEDVWCCGEMINSLFGSRMQRVKLMIE